MGSISDIQSRLETDLEGLSQHGAGTIVSRLAIAAALLFLAFLSIGAGRAVHGSPFVWALALVLAGGILTIADIRFRIV